MQQAPHAAASDAPPAQATADATTAQQLPPAASPAPRVRPMDATAPPGSPERYYSTVNTRDTVVCCAPNKVCVVYVSPEHDCFGDGRRVTSITFADRLASAQISGKRKRGAAEVAPDEKVLTITCDDGAEFQLRPGVRGRVLELGARLTHPDLSTRSGFLLILQSSAKEVARLLGEEVPPR
jgi:hypothetical protein